MMKETIEVIALYMTLCALTALHVFNFKHMEIEVDDLVCHNARKK